MIKRILACATVFAVGLTGMATVAQAQTHSRPRPARYQAKTINLHRAFEAALGHTKPGKISGIVYARDKQPKAAAKRVHRSCTEPNCPLIYHGGPVQHSPHVYLLLWGPAWSTNSGEEASAAYLESFYAGLGAQPQDNWSTITSQYGDGSGFPTFTGSVYEGAFQDASTPPSGVTQSLPQLQGPALVRALAELFPPGRGVRRGQAGTTAAGPFVRWVRAGGHRVTQPAGGSHGNHPGRYRQARPGRA